MEADNRLGTNMVCHNVEVKSSVVTCEKTYSTASFISRERIIGLLDVAIVNVSGGDRWSSYLWYEQVMLTE